jgi:hypothetical protein
MIHVGTVYPGVAPNDMETLVTRVIEEELNNIPEIKELTSTSVEGYSSVVAEFDTGMNMDEALQKVREKVDLAKPKLPADAEDPVLMEFNLSEFPIMQVNISGEYSLVQLKDVAEDLKDRLEQIPSILEVRLSGGLEREVKVDVDLRKLQFYGSPSATWSNAIRAENVTIPGGAIDVGTPEVPGARGRRVPDTRVIEDIVVKTLRTAGRSTCATWRPSTSASRTGQLRAAGRQPGGHAGHRQALGREHHRDGRRGEGGDRRDGADFPPTTSSRSPPTSRKDIRDMVLSLENNIISGLILVLAVLLFFLGVRNASFVAISIPMSMLLSFIVMKALGISMNMVVLFSLILALGMLVDNAIVVVENIYRHMEQGYDNVEAARRATGRGRDADHRLDADHAGRVLPADVLAGHRRRVHGLPAADADHHAVQLAVRGAGDRADAVRDVHAAGRAAAAPMTPARGWTLIGVAGGAAAAGDRGAQPARRGAARVTGRAGRCCTGWCWSRSGALVPGPGRAAAGRSRYERRLRWALDHRGLVLGGASALLVVAFFSSARSTRGRVLPESIPPATGLRAGRRAERHERGGFTNALRERIEAQLPGSRDRDASRWSPRWAAAAADSCSAATAARGHVAVSFASSRSASTTSSRRCARCRSARRDGIAGATSPWTSRRTGPPRASRSTSRSSAGPRSCSSSAADQAIALLKPRRSSRGWRARERHGATAVRSWSSRSTAKGGALRAVHRAGRQHDPHRDPGHRGGQVPHRQRRVRHHRAARRAVPQDLDALQDLTVMADGRAADPAAVGGRWYMDEGLRQRQAQGPGPRRHRQLGRARGREQQRGARGGAETLAVSAALPPATRCATPASSRTRRRRMEFLSAPS